MKNLDIAALNKALFISTILLYLCLAFGGAIAGHNLPLNWHIFFAIMGAVYTTIGIYYEEKTPNAETEPSISAQGQKKYERGQ